MRIAAAKVTKVTPFEALRSQARTGVGDTHSTHPHTHTHTHTAHARSDRQTDRQRQTERQTKALDMLSEILYVRAYEHKLPACLSANRKPLHPCVAVGGIHFASLCAGLSMPVLLSCSVPLHRAAYSHPLSMAALTPYQPGPWNVQVCVCDSLPPSLGCLSARRPVGSACLKNSRKLCFPSLANTVHRPAHSAVPLRAMRRPSGRHWERQLAVSRVGIAQPGRGAMSLPATSTHPY